MLEFVQNYTTCNCIYFMPKVRFRCFEIIIYIFLLHFKSHKTKFFFCFFFFYFIRKCLKLIEINYVPPQGEGHTDFGADPIGVGFCVTLFCLHNIL